MSQSDVIEYLEKYGEGSPDEMSKVLGIGQSSMSFNVNRCAKSGDIVLKEKVQVGRHWHNIWQLSEEYKNS